jgi:F-type H+-transporting ATPase subunit a
MITNLFSVFDPSSSIISLSWLVVFITICIIRKKWWKISNSLINIFKKITSIFKKEISYSLGKEEKRVSMILLLLFFSIIFMNFIALYPQIFSATSHLSINLPIALTFWLSLIIFGWKNKTSHMLSHLVPQGTPGALISFIVIIELTRNLIRPITLCVRLTANLIAGHLLISLMGNFLLNLRFFISPLYLVIPILLTILESAVACIQAYVFITLVTLYTTEIK